MNKSLQHYEINIKNCSFYAYHGVFEEEKNNGQRFYVDARLKVDPKGALEEDRIEGTVHYGEAFGIIEQVVTKTNRDLIETLALDIAKALCAEFPQILSTEITVRKPSAPIQGVLDYVEVTVCYPEN